MEMSLCYRVISPRAHKCSNVPITMLYRPIGVCHLQVVRNAQDPADAAEMRSLLAAVGAATAVAFDLQLSARMAQDPFQLCVGAAATSPSKVNSGFGEQEASGITL